ncbi:MAG: tRNA uridine-5-carboxymethylaminomethyl(34) synthesis GTPase MnmE [Xanthobacteraceae bacterium]
MSHGATIFALSSGRPPAAIAVVRVSGPCARAALEALSGRLPEPRRATLARLCDPQTGEAIDEALALWFPGPRSETGEDMAELQLHGGRAVIAAVLAALGRLEGFRPAEAGEFTRRAFENGRLDLTAVEGLADLIFAETEAQRRQAFRQLKGMLGGQAETWRMRLIEALALVEAGIDFSDEADVPGDLLRPALAIARALHDEISSALVQAGRGERLRDGLVVAIAGPPNVGKSTLLNRIAKREAAIVSPYAGTTRDVIEVHLDLDGYPVTLLDTAGVRESDDPVEQEGVRRARARAAAADLVLWVAEAGRPLAEPGGRGRPMDDKNDGDEPAAEAAKRGGRGRQSGPMAALPGPLAQIMRATPVWLIWNKADLLPGGESGRPMAEPSQRAAARPQTVQPLKPAARAAAIQTSQPMGKERNEKIFINEFEFIAYVSALNGRGIDELLNTLTAYLHSFFGVESGLITRQRHRHALEETQAALARALTEGAGREEILAEELRLSSRALGRLTGKVDVEDILDAIFRDFCIGK